MNYKNVGNLFPEEHDKESCLPTQQWKQGKTTRKEGRRPLQNQQNSKLPTEIN